MENTFQFKTLSVMGHGISVHEKYKDLIKDLDEGTNRYEVPDLLKSNWIYLKSLLYSNDIMKTYHVYHDCGKPYCRTVDDVGKQHFPDHEKISAEIFDKLWSQHFPHKALIHKFIASDMIFHSGSMEDIEAFKTKENARFRMSLWFTSLAELYANKEMFDSNNQLSFKIKYKKLSKCLNKILL